MSAYNILSIDIDYAYSPTISLYDDYVEGSRISLAEQQEILLKANAPAPQVNQDKLDVIKAVVDKRVVSDTPFHIIENHQDILELLPKDRVLCLYNFDHHHDVHYPGWHEQEVLDEGNWVSHLHDYKVDDFYWIRNKDSEDRTDNVVLQFHWHEIYLPEIERMPNFDLVVGCVSPHWTGVDSRKHLRYVMGV